MKEAAVPGFRLSRSRRSMKFLTSYCLLCLFSALVSAQMLSLSKTGFSVQQINEYYRGSTSATDNELEEMITSTNGRSFLELAEVTHIHLFTGSILLFLLCHLLSLCEIPEKLRITLYTVTFGSFLVTFSLPWAIVYCSDLFSLLYIPANALLTLSLTALVVIPLREMWGRQ